MYFQVPFVARHGQGRNASSRLQGNTFCHFFAVIELPHSNLIVFGTVIILYQLVALIFVIIILWSSIVVILMCNPSGVLSRGECGKRIVRSSSREILKKIAATFWSKVDEYIVVLNLQDIILFGQFFWEEQYFGDWCINTTLATSSCHIVNIGHLSWSGHLLAIQCLVQQNVSLEPS